MDFQAWYTVQNGFCRDDWIRTSDHQHPMLVRYQAALHPE
jgi:hypothetical protein